MHMRRLLLTALIASAALFGQNGGQSEKFNHVQWKLTLDQSAAPGATVLGHLEATVDPEWHMYSLTTPPGPIPTTITIDSSQAVDKFTIFEPPPIRKFDPNFNVDTETYEGSQTFLARFVAARNDEVHQETQFAPPGKDGGCQDRTEAVRRQ